MSESRHLEEMKIACKVIDSFGKCEHLQDGICRDCWLKKCSEPIATALALAEAKGMERAAKIAENNKDCPYKEECDYAVCPEFTGIEIAKAIRAEAMKGESNV